MRSRTSSPRTWSARPTACAATSWTTTSADPAGFLALGGQVFACGRDPYFPAWPDVLQLNAFEPGLRRAALDTVSAIAGQCDGVRCDMAMLVMNDVFRRTWGERVGTPPSTDYWQALVAAVKARWPEFRFLAEAYWDLEWALQQQGFDYCYDKRLYDRLEQGNAEGIRLHLLADPAYQERLVRFIENHDDMSRCPGRTCGAAPGGSPTPSRARSSSAAATRCAMAVSSSPCPSGGSTSCGWADLP